MQKFQYAGIPQFNLPDCDVNYIKLIDLKYNVGLGFSPLSVFSDEKREDHFFKGIGITNIISVEAHWFNKRITPFAEFGAFQSGAIATNKCRETYEFRKYFAGVMVSVGADIQIGPKRSIPIRFSFYESLNFHKYNHSHFRPSRYQLSIGYTFQLK